MPLRCLRQGAPGVQTYRLARLTKTGARLEAVALVSSGRRDRDRADHISSFTGNSFSNSLRSLTDLQDL
jgi:hypothetical protein